VPRSNGPGVQHSLFALFARDERKMEMAVARVEGDRPVTRAVRGEDQPRAPRQEMPDRGRRPFGYDDRIKLPQEQQRAEQDRQARMAYDRAIAQPAADPALTEQRDARRKTGVGCRHLLNYRQMACTSD